MPDITVKYVADKIVMSKEDFVSRCRAQDTFRWISNDGDLCIHFPNGHPFDVSSPPPYSAKKGQYTTPVKVAFKCKDDGSQIPFKYRVTLTDPSIPCGSISKDPHIIIDDGLGLGGDDDDHFWDVEKARVLQAEKTLAAAKETGGGTLKDAVDLMTKAVAVTAANGKPYFFPDGIQTISVDVEVGPVKVIISVSGK